MQELLDDNNVSWKAKGLYMVLVESMKDGKCSMSQIKKMSKDGEASTSSAIKELVKRGYVTKEPIREGGRFIGCKWSFPKEIS